MIQALVLATVLQTGDAGQAAEKPPTVKESFQRLVRKVDERRMKKVFICPTTLVRRDFRSKGDFPDLGDLLGGLGGGLGGGIPGIGGGIPGLGGGGGLGNLPGGGLGNLGGGIPGIGGGLSNFGGGGLGGGIGPASQSLPQQLLNMFVNEGQGRRIVPRRQSQDFMQRMTADQLMSCQGQCDLRERTGADGLIMMEVTDTPGGYCHQCELYDLRESQQDFKVDPEAYAQPIFTQQSEEQKSLGLLAYEGKSFEVSRINYDASLPTLAQRERSVRIEPVALTNDVNRNAVNSPANRAAEVHLYRKLNYFKEEKYRHPLEDDELPYRIDIVVNGSVRKPKRIGDRLYVRLERGERFSIRISNRLKVPVRFGVWIDGVNTIGSKLENPGTVDSLMKLNRRIWYIPQEKVWNYSGYHTADLTEKADFEVDWAKNALASSLGASQRVGVITAIVYSATKPELYEAQTGIKAKGETGVRPADFRETNVRMVRSMVGPMLAALSVHYRNGKELSQLEEIADDETKLFRRASSKPESKPSKD